MSGKVLAASKGEKIAPGGAEAEAGMAAPPARGGRGKLMILLAIPLLLLAAGGGAVGLGVVKLPFARHAKAAAGAAPVAPVYVTLPEIIANLDAGADGESYVKLKVALKLPGPAAAAALNAEMPAVIDMFQSYLRAMHPDDLRGAEGTYRLREALLARANVVAAPTAVLDVLFSELIVQ